MKATTEESLGVHRYTAQEMRVRADYLEVALADAKTAAMLRQAADDMEREEKYEYSVMWSDGSISLPSNKIEDVLEVVSDINSDGLTVCKAVRRDVGEWEEVQSET